MMIKEVRPLLIALLLMSAHAAFGWHEDKPPGATFQPEVTEDRLAQDQSYQAVQGEVGVVVHERDKSSMIDPAKSDSDAEQSVSQADEDVQAARTIERAQKDAKQSSKSGFNFLWAAIVIGVGFGTIAAARQWANRNIPQALSVKSIKW